jgi:hypothetical protein
MKRASAGGAPIQPDPELAIVRLFQVFRSHEPRVLNKSFDNMHVHALLQAVDFLVDCSLRKKERLRVIVPDQTVVDLL